jgi:hypothetical protein
MLLSSISGVRRTVPGVSALGLPFESQRKTWPHVPAHYATLRLFIFIAVKAGKLVMDNSDRAVVQRGVAQPLAACAYVMTV